MGDFDFGLGLVRDIVNALKRCHNVTDIGSLSEAQKLEALCTVLGFSRDQIDSLIADNPPVLRTVQGHVFEELFDNLVERNGYAIKKVGGDTGVDRILNGHSLQLKTPTRAGTNGTVVQYKTHKTHGAKSELESLDYYHRKSDFADFLVGLVTYDPLCILVLPRNSLPTHPEDDDRIRSPFEVSWAGHPGLNAFGRLGIRELDVSVIERLVHPEGSLLPKSSQRIGAHSSLIIDAILRVENFRIWDMNMRGFAREVALKAFLTEHRIVPESPTHCSRPRADKGDLALTRRDGQTCEHFQIKGLTLGACEFEAHDPVLAIETQLSRGRVNDHPTQSRLYLSTDFDAVIVCLEPLTVEKARKKPVTRRQWEFYAIPVSALGRHAKFGTRIASMQKFPYGKIQQYRIDKAWLGQWV